MTNIMEAIETKTLSLADLNNKIDLRKSTDKIRIQNKINKMMQLQSDMDAAVAKLDEKLPSILSAIESMGLGVVEFHYGKTGMDQEVWSQDDSLKVGIAAVTTGKFRFIKDRGYDSQGRGKNQKQIDEKAMKMSTVIKDATGIASVNVNPFSLEVDSDEETAGKRVLIELWIK